jgi:hypothetical protein
VWFALFALLAMTLRKGSLMAGALSIAAWVVLGASIVRAWALGPRDPGRE